MHEDVEFLRATKQKARDQLGTSVKKQKVGHLTSGSSGKMLSTSLLYRGLSAPQQPQTPEEETRKEKKKKGNHLDVLVSQS